MDEKLICRFSCTESWETMTPMSDRPHVRLCTSCNEQVFACSTVEQARFLASKNLCIMVPESIASFLALPVHKERFVGLPNMEGRKKRPYAHKDNTKSRWVDGQYVDEDKS